MAIRHKRRSSLRHPSRVLPLLLFAALPARAGVESVAIDPSAPSSVDRIRVQVSGLSACPFLSEPAALGRLVVLSYDDGLCLAPPTPYTLNRYLPPLAPGSYDLVLIDDLGGGVIETLPFSVSDAGTPPVPDGSYLESQAVPGFRFKVRISDPGGGNLPGAFEADCLPETICASGAVAGRPEVLLRVVGPKPNDRLWPTFVRFTTSTVEIWVEKIDTAEVKYYRLEGLVAGSEDLEGRVDRTGFVP